MRLPRLILFLLCWQVTVPFVYPQVPNPFFIEHLWKHRHGRKIMDTYFKTNDGDDTTRWHYIRYKFFENKVVEKHLHYGRLKYVYKIDDGWVTEVKGSDKIHLKYFNVVTKKTRVQYTFDHKKSDTTCMYSNALDGSWRKTWMKKMCYDSTTERHSGDTTFQTTYRYNNPGWQQQGITVFIDQHQPGKKIQTLYPLSNPRQKSTRIDYSENEFVYHHVKKYNREFPKTGEVEEHSWYLWK